MKVDCLWLSRHDDILSRGYADQGMWEAILDHSLWKPPFAYEFIHHEDVGRDGGDFPDVDGALVILPARHHTSEEDVTWFLEQIDRLQWSIVLLSGDEEWGFPWARVTETPTRRLIIMQPRPEHAHLRTIPGGWYPLTHDLLRDSDRHSRPIDFFFAGQVVDNVRRQGLMRVLQRLPRGHVHQTKGYMQGMPKDQYFRLMAQSKVVPSPSGPMTVDTARTYEALEAGCVPIVDGVTPRGESYDFWTILFGKGHPLRSVTNWKTFPPLLEAAIYDWPANANRHFAFWQQYKRKLAHQLHDDIEEVRQAAGVVDELAGTPDDVVTVIISTSPAPIHPSTDHIEQVLNSVRAQLPDAEIIIACDGVHPLDAALTPAYEEYLRRLTHLCNFDYHNVVPIISDTWQHQANMTRRALNLVTTPLVLFVEHDTPVEGDIPWQSFITTINEGTANIIRLHFDVDIHPDHEHLLIGEREDVNDAPLQRMFVYWQRPHLSSTAFYRKMLADHFPTTCRTMIEDPMHQLLSIARIDKGPDAWKDWRVWVYAPEGSMKRSGHLDSRGNAPKHAMRYQ